MTIGTLLFTRMFGEKVGSDPFGNVYYQHRKQPSSGRRKRWVIYSGEPEASRVPPEWHAWLHRTTVPAPVSRAPQRAWQKPHEPNLTGTDLAYRPPGHVLKGGVRAPASGDYEPWVPN